VCAAGFQSELWGQKIIVLKLKFKKSNFKIKRKRRVAEKNAKAN